MEEIIFIDVDHDVGTQCNNQEIRFGRTAHLLDDLKGLMVLNHGSEGVNVDGKKVDAAVH